jgi:two-component sensor histidine kinase
MSCRNLGTTHENGEQVRYPGDRDHQQPCHLTNHVYCAKEANTVSAEKSGAHVWSATHLRLAADAAGIALWSWNVDTDEIVLDDRAHELWGVPTSARAVTFENLSARIHPSDLDRVRAAFQATRVIMGVYDIDFRIVDKESVRWVSARGQGHDSGIVGQIMYGVFLDVTERKRAEEVHEMLASEMSHRVKNLFALTVALTTIASRSTTTSAEMAGDLKKRLTSLGQAHDLVRPAHGRDGKNTALFGDLLAILLSPYDEERASGRRIHISVPDVSVGSESATALAMVIHELATNSVKYGALSTAGGTLDVSCAADSDEMVVVWTERGGPLVGAPTGPRGFGSKLVTLSMSGQLGGSIDIDWQTEGAVVTLRMKKKYLAT